MDGALMIGASPVAYAGHSSTVASVWGHGLSSESGHETSQVFGILARCAERFGWAFDRDDASLVKSVPCRTGTIHWVRTTTVGDLAVKVCSEHWSPDDARSAFEVLGTVDQLLRDDSGVSVPKPYGWDERIPAVCMSWADGVSLRSVLETGQRHPFYGLSMMTDAAAGCGRAYGLLQAGTLEFVTADGSNDRCDAGDAIAHESTAATASSARRGKREQFRVLRGPGSTPQNVLVTADGHVTLVDSPRLRRLVSPHRALAKFLAQAFADMARSDQLRDQEGSKLARFERAFLEGYAQSGPADLRRRQDMRLLCLHRARAAGGLALAALRTQRRREALRLATHAAMLLLRSIRVTPLRARASKA